MQQRKGHKKRKLHQECQEVRLHTDGQAEEEDNGNTKHPFFKFLFSSFFHLFFKFVLLFSHLYAQNDKTTREQQEVVQAITCKMMLFSHLSTSQVELVRGLQPWATRGSTLNGPCRLSTAAPPCATTRCKTQL